MNDFEIQKSYIPCTFLVRLSEGILTKDHAPISSNAIMFAERRK